MDNYTTMIIIAIVLGIGLILAIISAVIRQKENRKTNIKPFFVMGITWIPIGIASKNYLFAVVGILMMIGGLLKKKEWKNEPKWEDLSPAEKRMKIILIIFLSVLLILGVVFYFIAG